MGMWDLRCMVTGLPLTANDPATAVLLTRVGDGYRPAALGLRGIYNCYGTIDSVVEDAHAGLLWRYAVDRLADGRLAVSDDEPLEPTDDIDRLLEVVERNSLGFLDDDPAGFAPAVTLDGETLHHALVYQPVWDGLSTQVDGPLDDMFDRLLGHSTPARELYRDRLTEVADLVRQLASVDGFVAARGLVWAPPGEERQRYPVDLGAQFDVADLRSFVDEARRDTAGVEALRAAVEEADRAVGEHEAEERHAAEQPPADWSAFDLTATALANLEIKRAIAVDEHGNPL